MLICSAYQGDRLADFLKILKTLYGDMWISYIGLYITRICYMVGIAKLVIAPDCGSGDPGFKSQYPPLEIGQGTISFVYSYSSRAIAKR